MKKLIAILAIIAPLHAQAEADTLEWLARCSMMAKVAEFKDKWPIFVKA